MSLDRNGGTSDLPATPCCLAARLTAERPMPPSGAWDAPRRFHAGFVREGPRQSDWANGGFVDEIQLGLLAGEYVPVPE
ncbi:hypothetical protein Asera_60330 [Actinocatenispora sera]|uniref:Uncharacterized protein n=1 Tax=Actinocatenispora sera TaxID=390989 RepID=A0A810LAM9_9ACTN|nr:hypothetical protein Asera_60330 [Actinocatenispora sera]